MLQPTDEITITLSTAEWQQIRAILAEQAAAFEAQAARNKSTIEKIDNALFLRDEPAPKAGPQLVS